MDIHAVQGLQFGAQDFNALPLPYSDDREHMYSASGQQNWGMYFDVSFFSMNPLMPIAD